jgi:hypothetical protein
MTPVSITTRSNYTNNLGYGKIPEKNPTAEIKDYIQIINQ